jgi:hypothetical protein
MAVQVGAAGLVGHGRTLVDDGGIGFRTVLLELATGRGGAEFEGLEGLSLVAGETVEALELGIAFGTARSLIGFGLSAGEIAALRIA